MGYSQGPPLQLPHQKGISFSYGLLSSGAVQAVRSAHIIEKFLLNRSYPCPSGRHVTNQQVHPGSGNSPQNTVSGTRCQRSCAMYHVHIAQQSALLPCSRGPLPCSQCCCRAVWDRCPEIGFLSELSAWHAISMVNATGIEGHDSEGSDIG